MKADIIEGTLVGISGSQPITLVIEGQTVNIHDWLRDHLGHKLTLIVIEETETKLT